MITVEEYSDESDTINKLSDLLVKEFNKVLLDYKREKVDITSVNIDLVIIEPDKKYKNLTDLVIKITRDKVNSAGWELNTSSNKDYKKTFYYDIDFRFIHLHLRKFNPFKVPYSVLILNITKK